MTKPKISEQLLTPNKYSRPTTKLLSVEKVVIHWVANPTTTAKQNRNFFELRLGGELGYGSAHFIIDDDEIIQDIPEDERAYHVGGEHYTEYGLAISSYPNARTLGIELTHPDWTGKPTLGVYKKTIDLCAYLCDKYTLDPNEDICLHYDITGKDCHKYYVNNSSEFIQLKLDVKTRMIKENKL